MNYLIYSYSLEFKEGRWIILYVQEIRVLRSPRNICSIDNEGDDVYLINSKGRVLKTDIPYGPAKEA
jgi:hypothetical protein